MGKQRIREAANGVFDLLDPLKSEERQRAIRAALAMLGETHHTPSEHTGGDDPPAAKNGKRGRSESAKEYFDQKDPQKKVHEFAVAARYLQLKDDKPTHTKEELKKGDR